MEPRSSAYEERERRSSAYEERNGDQAPTKNGNPFQANRWCIGWFIPW
ncbi:hypothetical protein [Microseira sp. BLCC-F43]